MTDVIKESAEEDATLAMLVKMNSDEEAFRNLFDKHYDWVYSKAYRILCSHAEAEEAAIDIFMKAWQKIDKWNPTLGSFQAWLNVVAKYTIIARIREKWNF